ncbi:MAG: CDP-glycerol glycerophosphotransferase family protein, partial [Bifidobacteriaceae bacterium]|nr:CDP-glycerol glycerophosphotransferase family protein [Bifidobacteriaceae bacterium]
MESPEKLFQELEKSYSLYIDTNFYIDIIQFKADKKTIQVMLNNKQLISSKDEISFTVNGKPINYTTYIRDDLESWKHDIGYVIRGYTFEFEWEKDCQLEILKNSEPQEFHYTVCANLSRLPQCFKESNGFVFNHNDKAVTIKRKKLLNFAIREARFWVSAAKEYGLFKGLQCAKLRTQIRFMRRAGAKNKILITDRINAGRDNGEALYRHLQKKGVKDIAFLILKDSEEGKRLAKDGFNIIQPFSKKHFFYLFTCSKIASSSFDSFIANPFRKFVTKDKPSFLSNITIDLYFGMLDFKYIFLTHGATKNDMTKVFRKENKNFNFILASNEAEAEHLKTGNYNFSDNEVVLTGLPRYDHLESEKSNTKKEN